MHVDEWRGTCKASDGEDGSVSASTACGAALCWPASVVCSVPATQGHALILMIQDKSPSNLQPLQSLCVVKSSIIALL